MSKPSTINYYTGVIVEVIDPVLYQVKVDIPGLNKQLPAFPMRGEIDEPKVNDFVLLYSFDPIYNSYMLYHKIKENDFIGFRSNGKMIDVTPDYIKVAIFDPSTEYYDDKDKSLHRPEPTDWITLDKDGNLEIFLRANSTITISGDSAVDITGKSEVKIGGNSTIEVGGNSTIDVSGNCDVTVSGNTTLDSPKVTITGGQLITTGKSNTDLNGPFNAIPMCPFSGAPHCGSMVAGT